MPPKIKYSDGSGPTRWFKRKMDGLAEGTANAISDAVNLGEDNMKQYILTRGTLASGNQGRVETGRMVSAVTSSFNRTAAGNAVGRFGWLKDRADYFKYQEGGFRHVSGSDVVGMYAMRDANEDVEQFLKSAIRDAKRNA